jgi:hypothetical protein
MNDGHGRLADLLPRRFCRHGGALCLHGCAVLEDLLCLSTGRCAVTDRSTVNTNSSRRLATTRARLLQHLPRRASGMPIVRVLQVGHVLARQ